MTRDVKPLLAASADSPANDAINPLAAAAVFSAAVCFKGRRSRRIASGEPITTIQLLTIALSRNFQLISVESLPTSVYLADGFV
jgi:hypothetical protein